MTHFVPDVIVAIVLLFRFSYELPIEVLVVWICYQLSTALGGHAVWQGPVPDPK